MPAAGRYRSGPAIALRAGGGTWIVEPVTRQQSRLRPLADMSPAGWVVERIDDEYDFTVSGVLPRGFEAYARILHPASGPDEQPVRWNTIAAWSGRSTHPTVQFGPITRPRSGGYGRGTPPWDQEPEDGNLAPALLAALCQILAGHTGTAGDCYFALWDGYGWSDGAGVVFTARLPDGDEEPPPPLPPPRPVPAEFPPEVMNGPRFGLPHREYLLFAGPLDAALELGHHPTDDWFIPQSPNLFWPADRAWCVATEIDLPYTYVGGSSALIDAVLADQRLESWPARLTDSVADDSDRVNTQR